MKIIIEDLYLMNKMVIMKRNAAYNYYKHGPLSRTVLGQQQVQGIDYAYTLHGWLKGVNGTNAPTGETGYYDMGGDGQSMGINSKVAKDIYSFALHYYNNAGSDYLPIGRNFGTMYNAFAEPGNADFKSLYNGNIAGMSVNNQGLAKGPAATTNALPLFYNYRYDQLNRIRSMDAYKGLVTAGRGANMWNADPLADYKEAITYDPNGNIINYRRNGSPSIPGKLPEMDRLGYNYYAGNNQLRQVIDTVPGTNYTEDIDNQTNPNNYIYDAIGNLKTDAAEGIENIEWTVYGKIASISKNINGNDIQISYTYDASGNRITKTVNHPANGQRTTVYVRDASGNVMSIYERAGNGATEQTETHLYGSSRIGIAGKLTVPVVSDLLPGGYGTFLLSTFTRGEKSYELSNHLGNVLVTISDRKLQVSAGGTTVDYYTADVATATDYYPFGMDMPGRKFGVDNRYGFNGKERDKDMNSLTAYDYGFRIYNPALGRFLSLDPLQKIYPGLTPYQFASNRPIDGIDLDGKEYITFHVLITKDAQGKPVFTKHIAEDYRGKSSVEMAIIHRNIDLIKTFYEEYSESFGPQGRGFKWIYFDENGKQIGEPIWQMRPKFIVTNKWTNSIIFNMETIGYYSGPGSITKFGPGLSTEKYSELSNDYDFGYTPMGYSDKISKDHDEMQENTIVQPQGYLEDTRTLASDIILQYKGTIGYKKRYGNSREDQDRLFKISKFFKAMIAYKIWKITELRKNYDASKPENQLRIILSDWNPTSKKEKRYKKLLELTGGAASESERNTVRPVAKKRPS